MKETIFIQQNKEKWEEFEQEFAKEKKDPEKLSSLFVQITDDLSYSRTYYPNRSVKIFLNNLAQKVFASIYRNKVRRRNRFVAYWKDEMPKIMFENRMRLLFAFLLFLISMAIGVVSSIHDPDFPRQILGNAYINMTEENIESGDPMKVYKDAASSDMFFAITWNNLQVAFWCFILGILLGAGTAYLIISNGIMLGVFQYFFIERDLFAESFLAIWVHGALEICAIVIAGAAGFELGKGILFPGTYSRMQSFRKSAIRGLRVFTGIIPVIIIAGFNESYLTRHTEVSDWVRGVLIAVEFAFMFFYYVYYPWKRSQTGFNVVERPEELPPSSSLIFKFDNIKTGGNIFSDAFLLFGKYYATILKCAALMAVVYISVFTFLLGGLHFFSADRNFITRIFFLLVPRGNIVMNVMNTILAAMLFALAAFCVKTEKNTTPFRLKNFISFFLRNSYLFIGASGLLILLLSINGSLWFLPALITFPYLCAFVMQASQAEKFTEKWKLLFLRINLGNLLLIYSAFILLSVIIIYLSNFGFTQFLLQIIQFNMTDNAEMQEIIMKSILAVILFFEIFILFIIFFFSMAFLFFSTKEITTAEHLKQRITQLGTLKRA